MTTAVVRKVETSVIGNSLSANLVSDWLAFNVDKSEATRKTYCKALENFFHWLSDNGITNPRREDVIEYRNALCATNCIRILPTE